MSFFTRWVVPAHVCLFCPLQFFFKWQQNKYSTPRWIQKEEFKNNWQKSEHYNTTEIEKTTLMFLAWNMHSPRQLQIKPGFIGHHPHCRISINIWIAIHYWIFNTFLNDVNSSWPRNNDEYQVWGGLGFYIHVEPRNSQYVCAFPKSGACNTVVVVCWCITNLFFEISIMMFRDR